MNNSNAFVSLDDLITSRVQRNLISATDDIEIEELDSPTETLASTSATIQITDMGSDQARELRFQLRVPANKKTASILILIALASMNNSLDLRTILELIFQSLW